MKYGVSIENDDIQDYGYLMFDVPLRFIFYENKDIDINNTSFQKEVDYDKYMIVDEIQELIETGKMLKSHGIIFNELLLKRKILKR